jgi:hypothetical protein
MRRRDLLISGIGSAVVLAAFDRLVLNLDWKQTVVTAVLIGLIAPVAEAANRRRRGRYWPDLQHCPSVTLMISLAGDWTPSLSAHAASILSFAKVLLTN